ncbi:hypothetical protein Q3A66_13560 [Hymenobacter sp. BT770]|uniref:hypothetical protein n=1 Tax=Hymenobacter sp. BT770 TaxID=2886942 RepID=UPI001D12E3F2|nr:hypothetical protein [Hymenobacter sp. BT770]MCC3153978.1 hypothetical protein [Hymenobacter sp. BT770]MDO3416092.1 hypothetical protein [Hymenobacter sp. BT770]
MRVYYENPIGRLLEHPHGFAVVQYNAGARDFTTFKAFLTHVSQLLRRHGWHKMLADQRDMAPFTEEERTWIGEFWLASSQSDGYELYGAVVIPSDVFARLSVNLVMNDSQHSALTYRLFEGEDEAEAWLRQLP